MINRFRNLLAGTADRPEVAQRQYLLNIILAALGSASLIFGLVILVLWLIGVSPPAGAIAGFSLLPFFLAAFWLARRGFVNLAALIPTSLIFAGMLVSLFEVGAGTVTTLGFALVVVASGILINAVAASIFALLSVGAYLLAQANDLVPRGFLLVENIFIDSLGFGLGLGVLVIFIWLSRRLMRQALQLEHEHANRLQIESQNLEEEVRKRTQSLERKATQFETIAEIARLASEMLDPQDLMDQVVELIRSRFGYYHVSIYLLDDTGNWANLEASTDDAGKTLIAQHHRLATGSASIIGWVTTNRLPRVSTRVADDPFYYRNPLLPETESELSVPLLVGPRLLGALDIHSSQPDGFSEDDVRALEAIAGELAIAIESSQLIRQTQMQLQRFEASYRDLARQSWSRIADKPGENRVHLGGSAIGKTNEDEKFEILKLARSRAEPVLSDDELEIAVPVQMRGEVIATIGARRTEEDDPWTEDDIALLNAVAGQTALALESARQYTEEHRRVTELEVVNRISQAVSQHVRLDSLYRVVHAQINQVLGETDLYLGLYDPELEQISFLYVSENREVIKVPPMPPGDSLPGLIIRTQQPLLLSEDTERRAKALGAGGERIARSWLGVPLLIGDEMIGIMAVQDFENEHRYTEDDAALLTTIASQVATALQNTQLMDQIQRTARRERLIHEITSKVRRAPDRKAILETAAKELNRALNATSTSIHLRSGNDNPATPENSEVETSEHQSEDNQ